MFVDKMNMIVIYKINNLGTKSIFGGMVVVD